MRLGGRSVDVERKEAPAPKGEGKVQPILCSWCGDVGHLRGRCVERIVLEAEPAN